MRRLAPTLMRRPRTQWTSMSHRGPAAAAALPAGDSVITRPAPVITAPPAARPQTGQHQPPEFPVAVATSQGVPMQAICTATSGQELEGSP